eukprot:6323174-Karenia_brevis.AAC.1
MGLGLYSLYRTVQFLRADRSREQANVDQMLRLWTHRDADGTKVGRFTRLRHRSVLAGFTSTQTSGP